MGFLFQVILMSFGATLLVHLPLWVLAKKNKEFDKIDYFYSFLSVLFYLLCVSILDIFTDSKSLTNLFLELVEVILLTTVLYVMKIFRLFKKIKKSNSLSILFSATVVFILAIYFLTPSLPE